MDRRFDLVVYGATGFTGRLVAEYLRQTYGGNGHLRWALAGRSREKLEQVRHDLGADASAVELRVADAADREALVELTSSTHVMLTTVGPYQHHGTPLVEACANAGTDYVDLCGEPLWMARMIPQLQDRAAASGARIVFSCGFDSIPFDLGVVYLQHEMQQRLGAPATEIRARVRVLKGAASGGTGASALATVEAIAADPSLRRTLADPYALVPGFKGPRQPSGTTPEFDDWAEAWTGPFIMAPINTKNVHRTHALMGHPWGTDFIYDERQQTGSGPKGRRRASQLARRLKLLTILLGLKPTRALLARFVLPKPGEGPGTEAQRRGRYEVALTGQTADGRRLTAVVRGDRDPGYGSTCKLIIESALCLRHDLDRQATPGGVWTPGAAMGPRLIQRLQTRAGLTFELEAGASQAWSKLPT